MSTIDDFYRKECDRIKASCVDAYIDLMYDPENPTGIILDHSWGNTNLDLLPLIKAGETLTNLELMDNGLRYNREDGQSDCIYGDDLSRIISLNLLKDVDQNTPPQNGDILIYRDGVWYTFDFETWKNNTGNTISNAQARITVLENKVANLEQQVANHENRLVEIEAKLTPPANIPSNARVVFGVINNYGDPNNSNDKTHGLYSHDPNTEVFGDQHFA